MTKIITLTLSPAFDLHCDCHAFAPYRENLAKITSRDIGGKGVNISRALTQNGADHLAIVALGKENASDFEARLKKDGIPYRAIYREGRIRENITLHTDKRGETRISFEGFCADDRLLEEAEAIICQCADPADTIVTLTGRVPNGISMQSVKHFLKRLQVCGSKIVIDSKSFEREDLLEVKPWLIKPNEEELASYAEHTSSAKEAAKQMFASGIEQVMISLGSNGAILACRDGIFSAVPPRIAVRSTIGAGDSMIAGFLAAYTSGKSAADCLRTAVAYGSAACTTDGTQPPLPSEINKIYNQMI